MTYSVLGSELDVDVIGDFVAKDDVIRVAASAFGGGMKKGAAIQSSQFRIGAGMTSSSDRFVYNSTNGFLLYDADGTGTKSDTVAIARLIGAPVITAAQIIVF